MSTPHIRTALDLRRVHLIFLLALVPCATVAVRNNGWRVASAVLVALAAGLFWQWLFAKTRRRPMGDGAAVTALAFVLTLPPGLPLWQVAVGMSFGIVFALELFGGLGRNFVHPALAARAFVYFAYPLPHSGGIAVDGTTIATPLTAVSMADVDTGMAAAGYTWSEAFLGTIPGALGETSTLACLLGAVVLLVARIASWRVMVAVVGGAVATALFFNATGSATNPMFAMPPHWHLVTGGFAFGLVFLATDPTTSAQTDGGRWVYGLMVGMFCILIRVLNPGYAESMMIVLILGNVFAPIIDWLVIELNVRRRLRRLRHAGA